MLNFFQKDEELKERSLIFLLGLMVAMALSISELSLLQPLGGQLTKEVFLAEMMRSFSTGRVEGAFPLRTFYEWYHQGPLPWAEEFPLYTLMVAGLYKLTGWPLLFLAKIVSLSSYIFFVAGLLRFCKNRWGLVAAFLPVYLIYGHSVMVEMPMMGCLIWGHVFLLEKAFKRSWLFYMLACLFKYYAIFSLLGVVLFLAQKKDWKQAFWIGLAGLPCIFYIAGILLGGIPNPISDYQMLGHDGHLTNLQSLLSGKFISRLFTWLMIKNSGVLWGIVLFVGVRRFFVLDNIFGEKKAFLCWQLVTAVLFILCFSSGVYIHDYYTIQLTTIFTLMAVLALGALELPKWAFLLFFLVHGMLGIRSARSALRPQTYLLEVAHGMEQVIPEGEKGKIFITGDGALTPIFYITEKEGKLLDQHYWSEKRVQAQIKKDVLQGKIKYVVSVFFDDDGNKRQNKFNQEFSGFAKTKNLMAGEGNSDALARRHISWRIDKIIL